MNKIYYFDCIDILKKIDDANTALKLNTENITILKDEICMKINSDEVNEILDKHQQKLDKHDK